MNTGCPLNGVCFPSFGGLAGPNRLDTKSDASDSIIFKPFRSRYFSSCPPSRKRRRNGDFAKSTKSCSMSFVAASSEQSDRRCTDHDLILAKLALQAMPVASPPGGVQRFRHDFEYDDVVVHRHATFRGGALGGRAGKCGQPSETLCQMLSDFGIFFSPEWLTAIVMEGQQQLHQMHRRPRCLESKHSEHEQERHRDRG
jgi:hypothetical protein